MKKIILLTLSVIFFTSCSDVFFTSPQPSFAEDLSEIPKEFQGQFLFDIDEESSNSQSDTIQAVTLHITDNTFTRNEDKDEFINYTISAGNLAVKSWGNYLFLNLKLNEGKFGDSTEKWELLTILSSPYASNNQIQYMWTENGEKIDVGRFDNVDTIPADTTSSFFDADYDRYILNEVSTLQFHYLLGRTWKLNLITLDEAQRRYERLSRFKDEKEYQKSNKEVEEAEGVEGEDKDEELQEE